jgi:hypothetical protein
MAIVVEAAIGDAVEVEEGVEGAADAAHHPTASLLVVTGSMEEDEEDAEGPPPSQRSAWTRASAWRSIRRCRLW